MTSVVSAMEVRCNGSVTRCSGAHEVLANTNADAGYFLKDQEVSLTRAMEFFGFRRKSIAVYVRHGPIAQVSFETIGIWINNSGNIIYDS